ncbi:MAG: anaerobic ribonucleoside-triphosphate reductase activating protein [archaeon]
MKIAGLQKVSTIDYPGEICCVIFLQGCNFRCGFCYNPELVVGKSDGGFSENYVLDFLKSRVGKLDGVCISGGEPLMSLDLNFVRRIKEMGFKIKIDTNGSFPFRLREVVDLGLVDYIAMDVKGRREDYSRIINVDVDVSKIEESMKIIYEFGRLVREKILAHGLTRTNTDENLEKVKESGRENNYEFRTTVVGRLHSKESIIEMARWVNEVCGGKPRRFFLQGFKNKGKMVSLDFKDEKDVGEEFLLGIKEAVKDYFEEVGVRV